MFNFLVKLISALRNPQSIPVDDSDRRRLQHLHVPQHCGKISQHDLWSLVHSEPMRVHSRIIKDAAMNHWFVCNNGVAHHSQGLTYDPFFRILTVLQQEATIDSMEKMWESDPVKNQQGNELKDFDQVWMRNFIHTSCCNFQSEAEANDSSEIKTEAESNGSSEIKTEAESNSSSEIKTKGESNSSSESIIQTDQKKLLMPKTPVLMNLEHLYELVETVDIDEIMRTQER